MLAFITIQDKQHFKNNLVLFSHHKHISSNRTTRFSSWFKYRKRDQFFQNTQFVMFHY